MFPLILDRFGSDEQKEQFMAGAIAGEAGFGFNLDRTKSRLGRDVAGDARGA